MNFARLATGLASVLLLLGCTGPDGPSGSKGADGTPGPQGATGLAGPMGPAGAAAAVDAGVGGGMPASCLSPCHGFTGVVAQWKTSAHYVAYVVNIDSDEGKSWVAPGSACGNCHAIDAIEQRLAGNVGTKNGGVVTNLAKGELSYNVPGSQPDAAAAEATYAGSATVAEVYCTTCHAVTDTNDPHKTGQTWTPGSFPLRVPSTATDQSFIEKSPTSSTAIGMSGGTLGGANTCITCHKSRKDVTNYITATGNVLSSTHWGPHEGPQADIFSGSGGYQYAGMSYNSSTHQVKLTCIDCHMPSVASNGGVGDHSFNPKLSACQGCHTGATNFDMGGGQSTVKGQMMQLEAMLNSAGYLTRSAAAPYAMLTTELGDGSFELDQPRPGGPTLTGNQAGALYNYILIARGGAMGVHNPTYVKQLIFDSFVAVNPTGLPMLNVVRPPL